MATAAPLDDYYRSVLPYYDASLEARGDLPFWTSMARRWGGRGILELGCGTGRVTAVLEGVAPLVAVDLLPEMIVRARHRAPEARLVIADLRAFAFNTRFDLVVLADDPMAHLTSTAARGEVLRLIAEHLRPDGRLVLEGLHRQPGAAAAVPAREVRIGDGESFTVEERWEPTGEDSVWQATYRYRQGSSLTSATARLRSWTLGDVERMRQAGLRIETLWGDFDERPFDDASPRMIVVARHEPGSVTGQSRKA
jgi:SAM-dependent methyltransferase